MRDVAAGRGLGGRRCICKGGFLLLTALALVWGGPPVAGAFSEKDITLSSNSIPQGGVCLLRIRTGRGEVPEAVWCNAKVYLKTPGEGGEWRGFIAADLRTRPGTYPLVVRIPPSGREARCPIRILEKDYGVRRLTLPKKMVDLDAETLKRVHEESRVMKDLWEMPICEPLWTGPFLRPVPGDVVGPFGRRSIINEQPRSPHSGVDLRGESGTPVMAANGGRVVLTSDHFFSGNSVVIDHGGGIYSMYFHLREIAVKQGQEVDKGQVIGLVGATGRATGPHLHWGIRINGARVDPLQFTEVSGELEE
ncbi:MAG: M23 family metallopeptidase [Deltaproteobacteria bacterium]|nr:M23 family metallopeptidase [Deltaproteobacteria bacterium]